MRTVFETPLLFIRPSSVSGVASRVGDILPLRERKFGIMFPHVNVGIDDAIVGGCERGRSERCSDGCSDVKRLDAKCQT